MNIPKTLKVGGQIYLIEYDANLLADRNRYAEVNYRTNKIIIDSTTTQQQKEESLLHEIIEIIDGQCDFQLSHQTVKTLSSFLQQVLKDNEMLK